MTKVNRIREAQLPRNLGIGIAQGNQLTRVFEAAFLDGISETHPNTRFEIPLKAPPVHPRSTHHLGNAVTHLCENGLPIFDAARLPAHSSSFFPKRSTARLLRNAGFPAGRFGRLSSRHTDLAAKKPPNLQTKSLRYAEPRNAGFPAGWFGRLSSRPSCEQRIARLRSRCAQLPGTPRRASGIAGHRLKWKAETERVTPAFQPAGVATFQSPQPTWRLKSRPTCRLKVCATPNRQNLSDLTSDY